MNIPPNEHQRPLRVTPLWTLLFILITIFSTSNPSLAQSNQLALDSSRYQTGIGQLPLSFLPNAGQFESPFQYTVAGMGGTIHFASDQMRLALPDAQGGFVPLQVRFDRANPDTTLVGVGGLPGTFNYFEGNDSSTWITDVSSYSGVTYRQLYDGIDLIYDGWEGTLKGTYIVALGADPNAIGWQLTGAETVSIDKATGDLVITLPGVQEPLIEQAPIAWQEVGNQHINVDVRYLLHADYSVGFDIGLYDPNYPLVIDPTLVYSTFIGSSMGNYGRGVTVDSAGNIFVVGEVLKPPLSFYFPIIHAIQPQHGGERCGAAGLFCPDIFVTKFNPAGDKILFSTYIGGSGHDIPFGMTLDAENNVYIIGRTTSVNFPTINALYPESVDGNCSGTLCGGDAFVLKLTSDGDALQYATYLGGTLQDGAEAIAVDSGGNAYITGSTRSEDFPIANALYDTFEGDVDAFLTKISADGAVLDISTYLGGSLSDIATGVALDTGGNIYLSGRTSSTDFPTTFANAFQPNYGGGQFAADAFVLMLDSSALSLTYSTYLGGTGFEAAYGIDVDVTGNILVTGRADSGFPTTAGAYDRTFNGIRDAFVAKLNPSATGSASLVYSSYLGGGQEDEGVRLTTLADGTTYVTGLTGSSNFPKVDAVDSQIGSGSAEDVFITRISSNGASLIFSTFLGGGNFDRPFDITHDQAGSVYVVGGSDSATSEFNPFPVTANAFQSSGAGAFLSKIVPTRLFVDLTLDREIVVEGSQVEYTLSLTNTKSQAFNNVVVEFVLPDDLTLIESNGVGSYQNGQWNLSTIAANSVTSRTFVATVQPGTAGMTIAVEAEITQFSPAESFGILDSAAVEVFVGLIDLELEKFVDNNAPDVGEIVTFTLLARNKTGVEATNVIVTEPIPDGLTFVGAVPEAGTYDSQTGIWNIDSLPGNSSTSLTLQASVDSGTSGTGIVNTATIAGGQIDANNQNNTAHETIIVPACLALDQVVWASAPQVSGESSASYAAAVSADGRYVAFQSQSNNLVPNDTNVEEDIFVYDQVTCQIDLVSVSSAGMQGNDYSWRPSISADGRYVAFQSDASNLVSGDTNSVTDVFVRDRKLGKTTRVSVSSSGQQVDEYAFVPDISANGRYVTFSSTAGNLDPRADDFTCNEDVLPNISTHHCKAIYVHDRVSRETTLISVTSSGILNNGRSENPVLSADGRFVAFQSYADNLISGDTNNEPDVFVHDRKTGRTWRVSLDESGAQLDRISSLPAISANGRYIAFQSLKTNVRRPIYVYDMAKDEVVRATVTPSGAEANDNAAFAAITGDGAYVAFYTKATNMGANGFNQIILHNMATRQNTVISVNSSGVLGTISSDNPVISDDGSLVAFPSESDNFDSNDQNGATDVYLRRTPLTMPPLLRADLNVVLSVSPDPIYIGNTVIHTAVVTNNGPADATRVILNGTVPDDLTVVSASLPGSHSCVVLSSRVSCDMGAIAKDASKEPRSKLRSISPIVKVVRCYDPCLDNECNS